MSETVTDIIELGSWSFNKIKLEDSELFSEYIRSTMYPTNLWSSNFAYLWALGRSQRKDILWKIIDGMLVVFAHTARNTLYLMCLPFGKGNPDEVLDVLYKCLSYCRNWNNNDDSKSVVNTVNSMQLDFLKQSPSFYQYFKTIPLVGLEKHFSVSRLITLEGKDFRTIRNRINKLKRFHSDITLRKFSPSDFDEVIEVGRHWSMTAGQKYSNIFDRVYFPEIIKHFRELNHLVLVAEINGKIVGMVSGAETPSGQAWACLVKYLSEYEGLCEFLIVEFAKEIHKGNQDIEYMNSGSDLGSKGLRFFKDRFRPVLSLKRYSIKLR